MATIQDLKDAIALISAKVDALIASQATSVATQADLDTLNTQLQAILAK